MMRTGQALWSIWCTLWAGFWAVMSWAAIAGTGTWWQDGLFVSLVAGSFVALAVGVRRRTEKA